jgi:small subunit ribosomal protein S2
MFAAGSHFGLGRSRRHPTVAPYVFGTKNGTDILDLEKVEPMLAKAKAFVAGLAKEGKTIIFVGDKKEAAMAVKTAAQSLNIPYVDSRWIGGTISNFTQIRKRIERYEKLISDREKGELAKYTKRERMLIDIEIGNLEKMFLGIVSLKKIPDALFVIDPRHEKNAVKEASDLNIPIVAVASSDCDISGITYPIVGNDAAKTSVQFFVDEIAKAYSDGKKTA